VGISPTRYAEQGPAFDALKQVGLLNGKGREHFKGCIVVPLEHPDEGVVGFYGRKIGEDSVSHLFLPGFKRGVLQWQSLKQAPRVWVAVSVLDAFSLWQAGIRDVTCLYGASCLHPDLENAIARFNTPEVVFCLDGDKAGVAATAKHARNLAERGLKCFAVHLPEGKDPNDLLRESGPAALKDRALNARPIAAEAKLEPVDFGYQPSIDGGSDNPRPVGQALGSLKLLRAFTSFRKRSYWLNHRHLTA
jgi:DNA primase